MNGNRSDQIWACTDWTTLTFNEREADLAAMLERAIQIEGGPAACCIPISWVDWWAAHRPNDAVRLATVLNFPGGMSSTASVALEAERAHAADEWDVVFPHESFRSGDAGPARELIPLLREWSGDRCLKVILETGAPWERRSLQRAAEWALECGADFLKTSTGKVEVGATPEAAALLLDVLNGSGKGLKVSGGIRTREAAIAYLDQAAAALGEEFLKPATFRLGLSNPFFP
jgi:deoxyribose-phosphate aldolase